MRNLLTAVKMASEADSRQVKGILKNSSSFDKSGTSPPRKEMKWDEMNILATYHPENKDYGHKKIDEPPTPYNRLSEEEVDCSEDEGDKKLDPSDLASRLKSNDEPKALKPPSPEQEESSDEDVEETPEERAKRKLFEQKRKLHYNEFQAIKLARQLMEKDDDLAAEEDEDEEEQEK